MKTGKSELIYRKSVLIYWKSVCSFSDVHNCKNLMLKGMKLDAISLLFRKSRCLWLMIYPRQQDLS